MEVLGCLANLYIPEFDFFQLVRKHDLLRFLATYAQPGAGMGCGLGILHFACTVFCAVELVCAEVYRYVLQMLEILQVVFLHKVIHTWVLQTVTKLLEYCPSAVLAVDDDILLEVVMFVGILCNEGTAPMLVDSGLVRFGTGLGRSAYLLCCFPVKEVAPSKPAVGQVNTVFLTMQCSAIALHPFRPQHSSVDGLDSDFEAEYVCVRVSSGFPNSPDG